MKFVVGILILNLLSFIGIYHYNSDYSSNNDNSLFNEQTEYPEEVTICVNNPKKNELKCCSNKTFDGGFSYMCILSQPSPNNFHHLRYLNHKTKTNDFTSCEHGVVESILVNHGKYTTTVSGCTSCLGDYCVSEFDIEIYDCGYVINTYCVYKNTSEKNVDCPISRTISYSRTYETESTFETSYDTETLEKTQT